MTYANQLKGLLAKADGKDKFVALLQYAAMFVSAGEPGAFLAAQKSLSAARKPFRVFKPVEFLMPLVERPPKGKGLGACLAYVRVPPAEARASRENLRGWRAVKKQQRGSRARAFPQRSTVASKTLVVSHDEKDARKTHLPTYPPSSSLPPLPPSSLGWFVPPNAHKQVKAVGMALYVGADHVVWATSAGVLSGGDAKARGARFQKVSLWAWFVASVASAAAQTGDLTRALDEMSAVKRDSKDSKDTDTATDTDEASRLVAAAKARAHMGAVATSAAQAFLALALLEKTSLSKRHVAALGVAVSVANCASLMPVRKSKTA